MRKGQVRDDSGLSAAPSFARTSMTTNVSTTSRSTVEELSHLSDQVAAAGAVVFAARRAVAGCRGLMSASDEDPAAAVSERMELQEALLMLKVSC